MIVRPQERAAFMQAAFRVQRHDFYLRIDQLGGKGNAGGESAAADRDKNGIHVLECVNHFESDGSLADVTSRSLKG